MNVLAIVGPAATEQFSETLVKRLASHGTVGRVRRRDVVTGEIGTDAVIDTDADLHRDVRLSKDGAWTVSGQSSTLQDVLDSLAPDCEYALVEGFRDVDLPKVVIGDIETEGEVLASGSTPEEVDIDDVMDALATVEPYETLESLVARVKESADETFSGAIATFTGRVRAKDHVNDEYTEQLEFERYDGVAGEKMRRIRDELESREGIFEVLLHHKTGVVEAGEDIVFVVVLAGHRTEAFRTVEDGINRLKEEVPLFKKEVTVDSEFWAHTGERQ